MSDRQRRTRGRLVLWVGLVLSAVWLPSASAQDRPWRMRGGGFGSRGPEAAPPTETAPGMPPGGPGGPGMPGGPGAPGLPAKNDAGNGPESTGKTRPYDPDNLPKPAKDKNLISLSFENADVASVLKALSEIWGKPITLHPDLTGTMTVVSARDVTKAESFEIMRAALNVRGFTLVGSLDEQSKLVEIWPRKDALGQGSAVMEGSDPSKVPAEARIITQVVPLKFMQARIMADTLQPLITKGLASIVPLESANALVITDNSANVKRLLEILQMVDKVPEDRRVVEVVALKNASAVDVQKLVGDLYADPLGGLTRGAGGRGGGMDFGGQPPAMIMQALAQGAAKANEAVKVIADTRTNSLVLYGPAERVAKIKEIINQLDQDVSKQIIARRFKLQFADAAQVAQSLNQVFQQPEGGAGRTPIWFRRYRGGGEDQPERGFTSLKENLVVPDLRTNSLMVTATAENMRLYEEMIRSLDQQTEVQTCVEVVPLEFAKAATVEASLRRLLRGSQTDRGWMFFVFGDSRSTDSPLEQLKDVTVVSEETSNSLIISGPGDALPTVRRLVAGLDQPQAQVYISVIIADVTLTDMQQLGVELSWTKLPFKGDTLSSNFSLETAIPNGVRYSLVHKEFQALLKALTDNQKVKVLSTPHITGLNNKAATISIGSKYPFPKSQSEGTGGQVVSNFDLQDIVVQLKVTPRVSLGSQMVTLDVDQQIDELTGTVLQNGYNLPLIATRRANTQVMVETGQTVVIGGIIRDKKEQQKTGVPLLSKLPLVGPLFTRTKDHTERTELMVFMTPFVVTTEEQMRRIKDARQQELDQEFPGLREQMQRDQGLYGAETPPKGTPVAPGPKPKPPVEAIPQTGGPQKTTAAPTGAAPIGAAPGTRLDMAPAPSRVVLNPTPEPRKPEPQRVILGPPSP